MSTSTEIVRSSVKLSNEQLAAIKNFNDFAALTRELEITVEDIRDYGTGFDILSDKGTLIGVPFMAIEWHMSKGDMGEFVSVMILTQDNRKLIVNDGSTGILQQLKEIEDKRAKAGKPAADPLYCGKGLRRSTYEVENPSKPGEMMSATTYYLAF